MQVTLAVTSPYDLAAAGYMGVMTTTRSTTLRDVLMIRLLTKQRGLLRTAHLDAAPWCRHQGIDFARRGSSLTIHFVLHNELADLAEELDRDGLRPSHFVPSEVHTVGRLVEVAGRWSRWRKPLTTNEQLLLKLHTGLTCRA